MLDFATVASSARKGYLHAVSESILGVDLRIVTWGDFMINAERVPWSKMERRYREFVCGHP
jgi:hypothetical protein